MGCSVYLVSLSRYTQPHTGANMSVFSWLKCDQKTLMLLFGFYQKMSVFDLLSKSVRRKRFVPNGTITYYSQSLICFRNVSVKAGAYLAFLIQNDDISGFDNGFHYVALLLCSANLLLNFNTINSSRRSRSSNDLIWSSFWTTGFWFIGLSATVPARILNEESLDKSYFTKFQKWRT